MKKTNKGFTIVELVVVIAVVAVLAAVLIPTFTSIIKKANDSAYLQERQSQKIEDLSEKIEKIDWYSWEEFEAKLASEIAKIPSVTKEDVNNAVESAVNKYISENISQNTGVTEDQVTKIVKEAVSGQVTVAQVEAIVSKSLAGVSGVTPSQVQAIVSSAIANMPSQTGVSTTQVQTIVRNAIADNNVTVNETITQKIADAVKGFETLTEEEVTALVQAMLKKMQEKVIIDVSTNPTSFEIPTDDEGSKTYVLNTIETIDTYEISGGNALTTVIINAPNVSTVNVPATAKTVFISDTMTTSTHISGTVSEVSINKGNVEIDAGAVVGYLVASPSRAANVILTLNAGKITQAINLEIQYHAGTRDTITINNKGTELPKKEDSSVNIVVTGTGAVVDANATTTNIVITNGTGAEVTLSLNNLTAESNLPATTVSVDGAEQTIGTGNTPAVPDHVLTETDIEMQNQGYIMKVNGTYYKNFNDAFPYEDDGNVIQGTKEVFLLSNIQTQGTLAAIGSFNLTIDLNGYNLSLDGGFGGFVSGNGSSFTLNNSGSGNVGGVFSFGTNTIVETFIGPAAVFAVDCTVTINGGTIDATGCGGDVFAGINGLPAVTINDGKIISDANHSIFYSNVKTITINGGTLDASANGSTVFGFKESKKTVDYSKATIVTGSTVYKPES